MSSPVSAPVSNTAKLPYVVQTHHSPPPTASGGADTGKHGPAFTISLSANAQAALKGKEGHTTKLGDGR
ncbi:hypothetical protein [Asticcacaulis solisilvae]|uniref:hypothetical protein n=1 Tax=Asticcacaulis solisilvae TaxID=1217274 RepID=UPI003FD6C276